MPMSVEQKKEKEKSRQKKNRKLLPPYSVTRRVGLGKKRNERHTSYESKYVEFVDT
jgi:hypothetical protein